MQPGEGRYRGMNPHSGAAVSSLLVQTLTVFQRSLTAMQTQVAELLHFAVPVFPTAEVRHLPSIHEGEPRGQGCREPGCGEASLPIKASAHPLLCVVLALPPGLRLCLSVRLSDFRRICSASSSC